MSTSVAVAPYSVPPSQQFDGNDGSWSTFAISVGQPGQDFRVLPSTKSGVTYLIPPDGCNQPTDPSNCAQLRGAEIFDSTQSTGFQVARSTDWSAIGQYGVDLEDALNMTAEGLFGYDRIALSPAQDADSNTNIPSIDRQVVAAVADMDYFMGVLPLGTTQSSFSSLSEPLESLMWNLRNNSQIPSLSYGYTAGAKYRLKSVLGSLTLGGYDSTRFKPNANDFSFTFSTDTSKLLTVGVESITATNTLQGTYSLSSGSHFSVIDSTVAQLWLPTDICTQFEQAFGLTYDPYTDLYLVNDTVHANLTTLNPKVTIKLVNSLGDVATNYTNIELPYAAFDLNASYPYYNNATRYFPIRRAANDTQYALGRTLLQEAYLIVDYERGNFTIAPAAFSDPLPAAQIVTIKSLINGEKNNSSSSLGARAIAGIVVGAVLGVILLGVAAFFLWRKRRQSTQNYELAATEKDTGSDPHLAGTGSNAAMKAQLPPNPHEMGGTPLSELASPAAMAFPTAQKSAISVNREPVELSGESAVPYSPPTTARWEEIKLPRPDGYADDDDDDRHGESSGIPTENMSWAPSDDATMINSPRSAEHASVVSPLTPTFGRKL